MPRRFDTLIDWSGDGDFADAGEDVSARVRVEPGIQTTRGRDQLRSLAPPMAGQLTAELDNTSRDYSPENGSSPLAGNLVPGRTVRVYAYDGSAYIYDDTTIDYEEAGATYEGGSTRYPLFT